MKKSFKVQISLYMIVHWSNEYFYVVRSIKDGSLLEVFILEIGNWQTLYIMR